MSAPKQARAWLLALAAAWPAGAQAVEIEQLEVTSDSGAYHLSLEARIAAPPSAVYALITDYGGLTRLHESIRESRVLRRVDASTVEIYTEIRACVAFFCRTIRRTERIEEDPPHALRTTVLPAQSNLSEGEVLWRLEEAGEGTRLRYSSTMNPDFWIPPLVGRGMMEGALETTTREMIRNIEDLASRAAPGDGTPGTARP